MFNHRLPQDTFRKRLNRLVTLAIAVAVGILTFMASVVLERIAGLLAMIVLAVLVAYLMAPATAFLERRGIRRSLGVLLIYLVSAAVIISVGLYAVPRMVNEATDLLQNSSPMTHAVQLRIQNATQDPVLSQLPSNLRDTLAHNLGALERSSENAAGELGLDAVRGLRSGAEGLIRGVLVLLLAFFLLTDAERIAITVLRTVPDQKRALVMDWIVDFDRVVGGFVRGQLLLAGITTLCVVVLLAVLGIKYAILLGLFAGILSIIPFVGPVLGAVPAVIVCATTMGVIKTSILLVALLTIFEIQGHVLTPIIIGRAVKVTPMVVFIAILAGAEVYGLLGTLLAIPIAGILRVALDRLFPTTAEITKLVHEKLQAGTSIDRPHVPPTIILLESEKV